MRCGRLFRSHLTVALTMNRKDAIWSALAKGERVGVTEEVRRPTREGGDEPGKRVQVEGNEWQDFGQGSLRGLKLK